MKTPEEVAEQILDFIFPNDPLVAPIRRDMAGVASIIREAVEAAAPRWISVGERLPDLDEDVLWFYGEDEGQIIGYLTNESRDYPGRLLVRQQRGMESDPAIFSHWMPLPDDPVS